jgi:hypothetical protein
MSTQIVYEVKEILDKLEYRLDRRLETIESRLASVEKRVGGWQAVLAFMLVLALVAAPIFLHYMR